MNSSNQSSSLHIALRRALGIILPIFLISLLISALLISVANDMYAFVKPDRSIAVYISPDLSLYDTAKLLYERGVIKNPMMFSLYALSKNKRAQVESFSGIAELNSSLSYRELLYELANKKT